MGCTSRCEREFGQVVQVAPSLSFVKGATWDKGMFLSVEFTKESRLFLRSSAVSGKIAFLQEALFYRSKKLKS